MRELFVNRARRTAAAGLAMLLVAAPAAAQRAGRNPSPKAGPTQVTVIVPALDGALVATLSPRHDTTDIRAHVDRARADVFALDSLVASTDSLADVVRINAAAGRGPVRVEPPVLRLLRSARDAWRLSAGLLDPTAAPLVRAFEQRERSGSVPSVAAMDSLRALVDLAAVRVDTAARTVMLPRAGMGLDLSLMARGRGFDVARAAFPRSAFTGGVIQVGANALAFGRPPSGDKWRIELVAPGAERGLLGMAVIDSGAVMIAADSERLRPDLRHPVRLVDARTGELPVATASVVVIAPTAEYANATAAALYMLPPDRALAVADSLDIAAIIVRRVPGGKPAGPSNVLVSRQARRLVEFATGPRRQPAKRGG